MLGTPSLSNSSLNILQKEEEVSISATQRWQKRKKTVIATYFTYFSTCVQLLSTYHTIWSKPFSSYCSLDAEVK
jgi:hypothetical protein